MKTLQDWTTGYVNNEPVKYRVVLKSSSKLMVFLSWCLFWQKDIFMQRYYTAIGRTIYSPVEQPARDVLEHEVIHVYDYQKNPAWFVFSYLFALPLGWTMRAHWERVVWSWGIGNNGWTDADWIVSNFCTSRYLWMWPNEKAVRQWVQDCIDLKYAPIKSVSL
jgi:hypothetical protein